MSLRERLGHATAGFGQNLVYNFMALFLLVYLYEDLGLSSRGIALLTVVLTIVRIWDAVNDILIGLLVDRTRTRWGTFRPYPLVTAIPIAVLTTLLFAIPEPADLSGETRTIVLIAVAYLIWDVFYTASDVPYWSLTSVMTSDETERTRLVAWARTAANIALALMTLTGPQLAKAFGWTATALAVCVIGMGLFTLAFFASTERVQHNPEPIPVRQALRHLAANRPLHRVLASTVLGFGSTIFQVGGAVLAVVVFGDIAHFTTLGAAMIGGMILGLLLSPALMRRWSRRQSLIASNVGAALAYGILFLLGHGSVLVVAVGLFVVGVTLGVTLVASTAMIGDTADDTELRTGERTDGSCFAGLTFTAKLNTALATMVFGFAVEASGYESGTPVTEGMRTLIWGACTLVPAASALLAIVPLLRYAVDERTLPARLAQSRAARTARPSLSTPHPGAARE
jgi:sugar (glycoside-pentoside-hexuronide) transporter